MTRLENARQVEEHMEEASLSMLAVQDRHETYWLIAYSADDRLFYQGLPEGDEDGQRVSDATGWVADGVMTDGPAWPLRLMVPADDPIDDEPCSAEMWSWDYFRHQQVDAYWMRCHKLGKHDEHKNSETGAHWPALQQSADRSPGARTEAAQALRDVGREIEDEEPGDQEQER